MFLESFPPHITSPGWQETFPSLRVPQQTLKNVLIDRNLSIFQKQWSCTSFKIYSASSYLLGSRALSSEVHMSLAECGYAIKYMDFLCFRFFFYCHISYAIPQGRKRQLDRRYISIAPIRYVVFFGTKKERQSLRDNARTEYISVHNWIKFACKSSQIELCFNYTQLNIW